MDVRILQYADAMPIKRSVKKEDNQKVVGNRDGSGASAKSGAARATGDVAEFSPNALRMMEVSRMSGKLKEIPDPREEKINDIISRLRSGALLNPDTVKSSISRMLDSGMIM